MIGAIFIVIGYVALVWRFGWLGLGAAVGHIAILGLGAKARR